MTAPLTLCNNASCSEAPIAHTKTLMNLITRVIREHIKKYYEVGCKKKKSISIFSLLHQYVWEGLNSVCRFQRFLRFEIWKCIDEYPWLKCVLHGHASFSGMASLWWLCLWNENEECASDLQPGLPTLPSVSEEQAPTWGIFHEFVLNIVFLSYNPNNNNDCFLKVLRHFSSLHTFTHIGAHTLWMLHSACAKVCTGEHHDHSGVQLWMPGNQRHLNILICWRTLSQIAVLSGQCV